MILVIALLKNGRDRLSHKLLNPVAMSDNQPFSFSGSLMNGSDIDVAELSGLNLTDEEEETLWWKTNERTLLLKCPCLEEIEVGETDAPLYSDVYYRYEARCKEQLQEELKQAIKAVLG